MTFKEFRQEKYRKTVSNGRVVRCACESVEGCRDLLWLERKRVGVAEGECWTQKDRCDADAEYLRSSPPKRGIRWSEKK